MESSGTDVSFHNPLKRFKSDELNNHKHHRDERAV